MNLKHGMRRTKLWSVWQGMLNRCRNPKVPAFVNYGGRGITVCDRWLVFQNFAEDMGNPPLGMLLDRVDNSIGYTPDNCRWATRTEQNRNRRNLRMLTVDGQTKCIGEWSELTGLEIRTIIQRLKIGWPVRDAVMTPLVTHRRGVPKGMRIYSFAAGHDDIEALNPSN